MKAEILEQTQSTTPKILSEILGIKPSLIAKELQLSSEDEVIKVDELKDKLRFLVDQTFHE